MLRILVVFTAAVVVAASGSPASADYWGGNATNFSYSNGSDLNGLFGEPFVDGDTFYFTDANFVVNAQNGGTSSATDTVSFDVLLNPGFVLSVVEIRLFGSYNVQGVESYVDVTACGSVLELGGLGREFAGCFISSPPFPVFGGANGVYSFDGLVDASWLIEPLHPSLHLEFTNDLLASAMLGGNATVDMRFEELTFEVTLIPEPATLLFLGLGAIAILRRRSH